jgi:hypothetical protein
VAAASLHVLVDRQQLCAMSACMQAELVLLAGGRFLRSHQLLKSPCPHLCPAGMEFSLTGPSLKFHCDSLVAITGATFNAKLDGQPVACWQSFQVKAGQTLAIGQLDNSKPGVSAGCDSQGCTGACTISCFCLANEVHTAPCRGRCCLFCPPIAALLGCLPAGTAGGARCCGSAVQALTFTDSTPPPLPAAGAWLPGCVRRPGRARVPGQQGHLPRRQLRRLPGPLPADWRLPAHRPRQRLQPHHHARGEPLRCPSLRAAGVACRAGGLWW